MRERRASTVTLAWRQIQQYLDNGNLVTARKNLFTQIHSRQPQELPAEEMRLLLQTVNGLAAAYLQNNQPQEAERLYQQFQQTAYFTMPNAIPATLQAAYHLQAAQQWTQHLWDFPAYVSGYFPQSIEQALVQLDALDDLLSAMASPTTDLLENTDTVHAHLQVKVFAHLLLNVWEKAWQENSSLPHEILQEWQQKLAILFDSFAYFGDKVAIESIKQRSHPWLDKLVQLTSNYWHRQHAQYDTLIAALPTTVDLAPWLARWGYYDLAADYYHAAIDTIGKHKKVCPKNSELLHNALPIHHWNEQVALWNESKENPPEISLDSTYTTLAALPLWKMLTEHYHQLRKARRKLKKSVKNNTFTLTHQQQFNQQLLSLLKQQSQQIAQWLGNPPCAFELLAVGSLSREEASPYSDVEIALLVAEENQRMHEWFAYFIYLWQFSLRLWHETQGLHLDHDVLPWLLSETAEKRLLCQPPHGLAQQFAPQKFMRDGWSPELYAQHRPVSLYVSDATVDLLADYLHCLWQEYETRDENGIPLYRKVAQQCWKIHAEDYQDNLQDKNAVFSLKERYLIPLTYWCHDLALYFGIRALTTREILSQLQKYIAVEFLGALEEAMTLVQRLRLEIHFTHQRQNDYLTRDGKLQDDHKSTVISDADDEKLQHIEQGVLLPAYAHAPYTLKKTEALWDPWLQVVEDFPEQNAARFLSGLAWYLVKTAATLTQHQHYYALLPAYVRKIYLHDVQQEFYAQKKADIASEGLLKILAEMPAENGERVWVEQQQDRWQQQWALLTVPAKNKSSEGLLRAGNSFQSLHPEIIQFLLKNQWLNAKDHTINWEKLSATAGNHLVIPLHLTIDQQNIALHLKIYPEYPMVSIAIQQLYHLLMGDGTPLVEFCAWQTGGEIYPVLISQTVAGDLLQKYSKTAPEDFPPLSKKHYSQRFILTLLTNPEDDKPDNEILTPFPTAEGDMAYQLRVVDTDRAFVPPFVQGEIYVKSVIYCDDLMDAILDSDVRQDFLRLKPQQLLTQWLTALEKLEKNYSQSFTPYLEEFFGKSGLLRKLNKTPEHQRTYLLAPFKALVLQEIFAKLQRLQEVMVKNPKLTHHELLAVIHPHLAEHYQRARVKEKNLLQRFNQATEGAYAKQKRGHELHTSTLDFATYMKNTCGQIPERKQLQTWWQQDWQQLKMYVNTLNETENKIDLAARELSKGNVELFLQLSNPYWRSRVLHRICFRKEESQRGTLRQQKWLIADIHQEKVLRALISLPWQHFYLPDCRAFNNKHLVIFLKNSPELQSLQLRGSSIDSDIFKALARFTPYLEILDVSETAIEIHPDPKFPQGTILPCLRKLILENCPNLTTLVLDAPALKKLSVRGCGKLEWIRLTTKVLQSLNVEGCDSLKPEGLFGCVPKAEEIKKLCFSLESRLNINNKKEFFQVLDELYRFENTPARKILIPIGGNSLIGKYSCAKRFTDNIFKDEYSEQEKIEFFDYGVISQLGKTLKIAFDSTSYDFKSDHYLSLCMAKRTFPLRNRQQPVLIVMFDLTDLKSFEDTDCWIEEVLKHSHERKPTIILAGNKCDLPSERQISPAQIMARRKNLEQKYNVVEYIECSAKTGANIDKLFLTAIKLYLLNTALSRKKTHFVYSDNLMLIKHAFLIAYPYDQAKIIYEELQKNTSLTQIETKLYEEKIVTARKALLEGKMAPFLALDSSSLQTKILQSLCFAPQFFTQDINNEPVWLVPEPYHLKIIEACLTIRWQHFYLTGCSAFTNKHLIQLLKNSPNLQTLHIPGSGITGNIFTDIAKYVPQAQEINLSYTALLSKQVTFPELQSLTLNNCVQIETLRINAPQLKRLSLQQCKNLQKIKLTTKELEFLDIDGCINLKPEGLFGCVPEASKMKEISGTIYSDDFVVRSRDEFTKWTKKNNLNTQESKLKIEFFGNPKAGCSSCILRFIHNDFNEEKYNINEECVSIENYNLHLSLNYRNKYRNGHLEDIHSYRTEISIIMFDLTNESSFSDVPAWLQEALKLNSSTCIILAGNKCDLHKKRIIPYERVMELVKKEDVIKGYIECSAKTGENIEMLFFTALKQYINPKKQNPNTSELQFYIDLLKINPFLLVFNHTDFKEISIILNKKTKIPENRNKNITDFLATSIKEKEKIKILSLKLAWLLKRKEEFINDQKKRLGSFLIDDIKRNISEAAEEININFLILTDIDINEKSFLSDFFYKNNNQILPHKISINDTDISLNFCILTPGKYNEETRVKFDITIFLFDITDENTSQKIKDFNELELKKSAGPIAILGAKLNWRQAKASTKKKDLFGLKKPFNIIFCGECESLSSIKKLFDFLVKKYIKYKIACILQEKSKGFGKNISNAYLLKHLQIIDKSPAYLPILFNEICAKKITQQASVKTEFAFVPDFSREFFAPTKNQKNTPALFGFLPLPKKIMTLSVEAQIWIRDYVTDVGGAPFTRIDNVTLSLSIEGTDIENIKDDLLREFAGYIQQSLGTHEKITSMIDDHTLTLQFNDKNTAAAVQRLLEKSGFQHTAATPSPRLSTSMTQ